MYQRLFVFLFFFISFSSIAQVTTEPAFPRANQKIKIIYDSSKGTTGLTGVDPIYIHIGAVIEGPTSTAWGIVPFTWGTSNSEARMKKVAGSQHLWEWELTPQEFFKPTASQTIYRLGMVFRNASGDREGKTDTNQDFFVDISQGFQVVFAQPSAGEIMLEVGQSLQISLISSEISNISLAVNNVTVTTASMVSTLDYTFNGTTPGQYVLKAKAVKDAEEATSERTINVVPPSPQLPLPAGQKKGINYLSPTSVYLVLEAPGKKNVYVIGDFNDWKVQPDYQMNRTPDGKLFWLKVEGLVPKQEYIFQYLVDGDIRIGDPYADKVSDPFHDQEVIQQNRYPGLKPYPAGKTNFQATFLQTDQEKYAWKYLNYTKPKMEDLVIYELLIRDFDDRRTFKAVTERLDYLKDLGINAIELLPVKEFEGNLSWGYNPSFFFAVDKFYGPKNHLKELIDEAHKRNMVVILDMVLNHAFGQNPMVRLYNDGDYGAPTADNPWFNRQATHPFNVGYDFNHESAYTKAFVDSVNHYWLEEYKVDGFRFDLSKGFTQVVSGNDVGLWSQRDNSRILIWKKIYDQIKKNHPEAYVILEHFADNSEERELADYGLMFWGNANYDFREMAKGNSRDFNWAYYKSRGWAKNTLVSYMESHDEERTMWESLNFGATSPINIRQLKNAVNRNQLLAAFFFALPGPKMLWQFEEFGYDLELNNDRLGIKPTRWNYLNDPERLRLWKLYQAMIAFRKTPGFVSNPEATLSLSQPIKSIHLKSTGFEAALFGNFGLAVANNTTMTFPSSGTWYDYFSGEEVQVTNNQLSGRLRGNEFRLYTKQKLPTPEAGILMEDLITSLEPGQPVIKDWKLFPVPVEQTLKIQLPDQMKTFNYKIIAATGAVVKEGQVQEGENNLQLDVKDIRAGLYIFEINDNREVMRKRFIKQ
jgi:1,4-alpha-glucan branching enzyme